MSITIRNISPADYPILLDMFREFAIFEKVPERMSNDLESMLREQEYIHGLVAVTDSDDIVGYATWFFAYYTWYGKSIYLDDLYVKPAWRGQSIGTRLINAIIILAKQENCHKMRWQVSRWNTPAIEFYRNLGAIIDEVEHNCDLYPDQFSGRDD